MPETVTNASIRFRLRWRNDITAPRSAVAQPSPTRIARTEGACGANVPANTGQ